MQLAYFYEKDIKESDHEFLLSDITHKHCIQVLRKKVGDHLLLVNGRGLIAEAVLKYVHKHQSVVQIESFRFVTPPLKNRTIALSLLKNSSRYEWFLEKAVEIGIDTIVPLICEHSERRYLKKERMQQILTSAMLQSQRAYLPELREIISFEDYVAEEKAKDKYIAYCDIAHKKFLKDYIPFKEDVAILIGPEGDFSSDEIAKATETGWMPVSLGEARLRSETAAVYSSVLLNL